MKMKIAQIAPPWFVVPPRDYGGTESVLAHLVEEQVALGHDVTLFAPGDARSSARLVSFFPRSLIGCGVPWEAHLKASYHLHKAVEAVREGSFDIVHAHLSSSADLCLFPLLAGLAVPHVLTLHSRFPFDHLPNGWIGDADALYLEEWAPAVPMVAISEFARAEAPSQLHFAGVVHHGLPLEQFRPTQTKERGDSFVWVGRCTHEKGVHLAIQAAQQAGVPLILAGTVDRHVPRDVRYFREQIEPHLDNERVRYIGPVSMQEKIDLLSCARGFLNPLQWEEPFGMVTIEAMALGCPVISFARGAAPELIVHGRTGFLVEDRDEMVRCIPRVREIDRQATRQHVAEHFSARTMAQKYTRIYQSVIGTSKAASRPLAAGVGEREAVARPSP
jgi:glycosyltransferase involved in cell wall biosynthesis